VRAGYLGEKLGPPSQDPADMEIFFETIAGGLDSSAVSEPGVIQWNFRDAEPWHVAVANGDTHAERGLSPSARVTFKSSFEDFVDVAAGRQDPRMLALRGRMRYRGDLRWLWKSRRMFPA